MRRFILLAGLIFSVFISTLQADEGMWLLSQLKQLNLQKKGMEISNQDIYNPDGTSIVDAIVWLGGCSASFVSPQGLLVTNHHCAYGALQRASAKEKKDYISSGFLAESREKELPALGVEAYTLLQMTDVTGRVLKSAEGIEDLVQRERKIEETMATIKKEHEKDRDDISARVASMFNGKQYILYVYKKYRDVRIVYSPPSSIGKYGGDIDNWMWPRHTGDFTFMRVYQAPDGSGATYSTDNVPVHPKNYLHIARRPQQEGDFNFIIGFPGKTTRWRTSYSADWNLNHNYIPSIREFQEIIDLMDELTKDDPQGKIKVAGMHAGIANVLKNYQGKRDGMLKSHFIQKKQNFEKRLMYFINHKPELKKSYGTVLEQIKDLYDQLAKTYRHDELLNSFGFKAGGLASLAGQLYGIAREREKPEAEREPGFSEKQIKRMVERLKYRFLSYYEPLDKALFKRVLQQAQELPDGQRVAAIDDMLKTSGQSIDEIVDQAYNNTKLKDLEFVQSLFSKSSEELEKLNDPFINLAVKLYPDMEAEKKRGKEFGAQIDHLRSQYLDMLYAWKGKNLYPDANSTMRLTYGYIKGYKPADAITYSPFTTLQGVIEKNTGKPPFNMPGKLAVLEARRDFGNWYDRQLDDVPVAFLNTCDITGGNSGSAVMNSKGELVGLAFDGNYEAMTSDWQFDRNIQRTIAVDIRYVLFITQKFAGADYLIKELGF